MSPVKYIVLKVGSRGMTLASIHPAGKKEEAHNNARSITARENKDTIVALVDTYYSAQVLEENKNGKTKDTTGKS